MLLCALCRGEAASSSIHEELGVALTDLMPIVNMAFFSLAGASLILVSSHLMMRPVIYRAADTQC